MKTNKTDNYGIFKTVLGNRKVFPGHVKRLVQSIREKNLLENNPILVNKKMEVIDGQHRLKACEELGLPVYYNVAEYTSLKDVHLLNSNSKVWSVSDYVESYIALGNEDFIKLKDFKEKWSINYTTSANLLQFGKANTGYSRPQIRNGEFVVLKEKEANEIMEYVHVFANYTDRVTLTHNIFVSAVLDLKNKGFTKQTVLNKLKDSGRRIYRMNIKADYLRELESLMNHGKSTNLLRF